MILKGQQEEFLCSDETILYLDCGDDFKIYGNVS